MKWIHKTIAPALTVALLVVAGCDPKDEDTPPGDPVGAFTGESLQCGASLAEELQAVRVGIEPQFEEFYFDELEAFVADYRDADNQSSPLEAYSVMMIAAVADDNAYPFCIAALDALLLAPDDPMLLNSVAVCLLALEEHPRVGPVLDCAHVAAPDLPLTYDNAAAWYVTQGRDDDAFEAKLTSFELWPDNISTAWNAMEYARDTGATERVAQFSELVPLNYPLENGEGGIGGDGDAKRMICCACNGKFYADVNICLDDCEVTLACFTGICGPAEMCCQNNSPFTFALSLCVPPMGLQACVEIDTDGNLSVMVGVNTPGGNGGIKGTLSLSDGDTSVSVYGNGAHGALSCGSGIDLATGKATPAACGVTIPAGPVAVGLTMNLPTQKQFKSVLTCG